MTVTTFEKNAYGFLEPQHLREMSRKKIQVLAMSRSDSRDICYTFNDRDSYRELANKFRIPSELVSCAGLLIGGSKPIVFMSNLIVDIPEYHRTHEGQDQIYAIFTRLFLLAGMPLSDFNHIK